MKITIKIIVSVVIIVASIILIRYYKNNDKHNLDEFLIGTGEAEYIHTTSGINFVLEEKKIILNFNKRSDSKIDILLKGGINCRVGFYDEKNNLIKYDNYTFESGGPTIGIIYEHYLFENKDEIFTLLTTKCGSLRFLIPLEDKTLDVKIPCKPNKKDLRKKRMKELTTF